MTEHICPRCGHQDECSYGSWHDRHPFLAVAGGLLTLVWMSGVFAVYPGLGAALTVGVVAFLGVRALSRRAKERQALVRRADYEHAQMVARSMPQPIHLPARYEPAPTTPLARGARTAQPARGGWR